MYLQNIVNTKYKFWSAGSGQNIRTRTSHGSMKAHLDCVGSRKDGFHSSNLNSTTTLPPMTKIDLSVDHIHYWTKEKKNSLTTSKIRLQNVSQLNTYVYYARFAIHNLYQYVYRCLYSLSHIMQLLIAASIHFQLWWRDREL